MVSHGRGTRGPATARRAATWALGFLLAITAACGGDGSSTPGGQPPTTTAPTTVPPPTAPTTTVPKVRTVALGESFSVRVGESVSVSGAGVSVTFSALVSDSRCPRGAQCIQAGKAVISVAVARAGGGPVTLTLDTDGPRSARSGNRSVELISISRGVPTIAQLKVA